MIFGILKVLDGDIKGYNQLAIELRQNTTGKRKLYCGIRVKWEKSHLVCMYMYIGHDVLVWDVLCSQKRTRTMQLNFVAISVSITN